MSSPNESAEEVLAAARALVAAMMQSLSPALDEVRLEDFQILALLASRGPLQRHELIELTAASPLAVEQSLRRLSATTRVVNHDVTSTITPRGHALVDEVTERRRARISRMLSALSVSERQAVAEALALLAREAGEPRPEQLFALGL